jgi:hypothetical protein
LERQLGNSRATFSAIQIDAKHLARATVETAATTTITTWAILAESAVAIRAVYWAATGRLKRQLRDVSPAFSAGQIHIKHLSVRTKSHSIVLYVPKMLFGLFI